MNPFDPTTEADRFQIWDRLVAAECGAFVAGDWSQIEDDFEANEFEGVRCFHSTNPDDWQVVFPDLASYRESWLTASRQFLQRKFARHTHLEALLARTHLTDIDIKGDRALAHKKFFGALELGDGSMLDDRRQTLYRLRRCNGVWKTVGFFGQLPLELT